MILPTQADPVSRPDPFDEGCWHIDEKENRLLLAIFDGSYAQAKSLYEKGRISWTVLREIRRAAQKRQNQKPDPFDIL